MAFVKFEKFNSMLELRKQIIICNFLLHRMTYFTIQYLRFQRVADMIAYCERLIGEVP